LLLQGCPMYNTIKGLRIYDHILILFFLLLNLIIVLFHKNQQYWHLHLLKHFSICLLVLIIIPKLENCRHPVGHFIRDWYVIILLPFIYLNMGNFIHLIFPNEFDPIIISLETGIFGQTPNILLQRIENSILTEIMQLFYALYWFTIPGGALLLYAAKKYETFHYFIYYISLTFFLSYILFIIFPVYGPRFVMADQIYAEYRGVFLTQFLRDFVNNSGHKGCAFPSSHVAVAVVILHIVWWEFPKTAKWVFVPAVTGLSIATVYGQYHYLTDMVAGLVMGIIIGQVARMRFNESKKGSYRL